MRPNYDNLPEPNCRTGKTRVMATPLLAAPGRGNWLFRRRWMLYAALADVGRPWHWATRMIDFLISPKPPQRSHMMKALGGSRSRSTSPMSNRCPLAPLSQSRNTSSIQGGNVRGHSRSPAAWRLLAMTLQK